MMTSREKIVKLAIWAANRLAPNASIEEIYQHACVVWRDSEQEFHWQERNDLKSFFFFLFGEFHYEHQKEAAEPAATPAMREELTLNYPALVDASGVISAAEAQRLGIGEHAPNIPNIDCQDDYEFYTGTGRYADPPQDEPDGAATVQEVYGCHLCGRGFPTYNAYIMHVEFCPGME